MEVINPRAALLSNYEVLALLRELESDHLKRTKTALRIKKEEDVAGTANASSVSAGGGGGGSGKDPITEEVCENLRTVEVEAIQYLSADYQPTASQTPSGITQLVKDLAQFDLTKAEKLQVVNLAPTEPVELYVIVEELEDRLGDRMDDILNLVRASLQVQNPNPTTTIPPPNPIMETELQVQPQDPGTVYMEGQEDWDAYLDVNGAANDLDFDDMGEGAGVEGDLDMDDD